MQSSKAFHFEDCHFLGNSAGGETEPGLLASAAEGGAVAIWGGSTIFTFVNCDFVSNKATDSGGAFVAFSGVATFSGCFFELNTAWYYDGGAVRSDINIPFRDCTFMHNSCGYNKEMWGGSGGAVHGFGSHLRSTFVSNWAGMYFGGAMYGDGSCVDCIFVSNTASDGGAVGGSSMSFWGTTFFANTAVQRGPFSAREYEYAVVFGPCFVD